MKTKSSTYILKYDQLWLKADYNKNFVIKCHLCANVV